SRKSVRKGLSSLAEDSKKAAKILNVKTISLESLPDNRFDSVDLLDVVKLIEKKKNQIKPDLIITHHYADLNMDHSITCRAVLIACRPLESETVKTVLSFEVPSSTEWSYGVSGGYFKPNFFVPLEEKHIKLKIKAMQCYKSESRLSPHPRSSEALRA